VGKGGQVPSPIIETIVAMKMRQHDDAGWPVQASHGLDCAGDDIERDSLDQDGIERCRMLGDPGLHLGGMRPSDRGEILFLLVRSRLGEVAELIDPLFEMVHSNECFDVGTDFRDHLFERRRRRTQSAGSFGNPTFRAEQTRCLLQQDPQRAMILDIIMFIDNAQNNRACGTAIPVQSQDAGKLIFDRLTGQLHHVAAAVFGHANRKDSEFLARRRPTGKAEYTRIARCKKRKLG